jgi:hypothetical protein
MKDSRERTLDSGLSFKARVCPGLFPASSLIDAAKGIQGHDEQNDNKGGDNEVAAYPTRLRILGIADMLVTA